MLRGPTGWCRRSEPGESDANGRLPFSTIEGETISKAKLQGQVVLLDFWASWCEPCVKSVPIMADLNQKFAGREFELAMNRFGLR